MGNPLYLSQKGVSLATMLESLRDKMMAAFSIGLSVSLIGWQTLCWWLGVPVFWYGLVFCQVVFVLVYTYYFFSQNLRVLRYSQLTFLLLTPLIAQLSIESGSGSGIVYWAFLAPIASFIAAIGTRRSAMMWLAAYVLVVAAAYVLDIVWLRTADVSLHVITAVMLPINAFCFTAVLAFALYYYSRNRGDIDLIRKNQYISLRNKHADVREKFEGSSVLLNNVLPERIINRLLKGDDAIADGHADVAVMFVDLVGFTKLTESMSPKQIVNLLNRVFSGFDAVTERHGLEKIKTIGDAYMTAGGLTKNHRSDYVLDTMNAALDCQKFIKDNKGLSELNVALHIGIATGPIAAGVIGVTRLTYDIWGSTVNRASRLLGAASAGQILIDQTTCKRLSSRFEFAEEGSSLKGMDEVKVYRLLRRAGDSSDSKIIKLHA
ncbi:MAG: adenylate/guanylate cyclase domain-containing protein [Pseudomonadota bacterium]